MHHFSGRKKSNVAAQVLEPELEMVGPGRRLRSFFSCAQNGSWHIEAAPYMVMVTEGRLSERLLPTPTYPPRRYFTYILPP